MHSCGPHEAMQIKGASERVVRAAKTLDEIKLKSQKSLKSERSSPTFAGSASAQDQTSMLAIPRHSVVGVGDMTDKDVDDLLAEGKIAAETAIDTKSASAQYDAQKPQPEITKSIEHENHTVDDTDEWLVLTNFYDEEYRQKTLARHRRLKAIEEEKQQLLWDEQEELRKHRAAFNKFPVRPTPTIPEPPTAPELPIKQDKSSYSPPPAKATPPTPTKESQKRSQDEMQGELAGQHEHPAKVVRRQSLERFHIEPLENMPPRGPANKSEKSTPQRQQNSNEISHRFTRPDLFDDYNAPRRVRGVPDTRYFHIRSWNHDNVRAAQQDCTWVTQKTNERAFIEAFEQSRRVILFFSVNNSKAFQGIAEMGSVPGAAGLPNPPWKTKLHWPSTDAFALIWLLKQDIPHYTVRHLTNPLNENLPAHVGTDGVEIDAWVGEQMYSILHNYARRGNGRRYPDRG